MTLIELWAARKDFQGETELLRRSSRKVVYVRAVLEPEVRRYVSVYSRRGRHASGEGLRVAQCPHMHALVGGRFLTPSPTPKWAALAPSGGAGVGG